MKPSNEKQPQFAQIYFFDQAIQSTLKKNIFNDLSISLLNKIREMLYVINPYVKSFQFASNFLTKNPELDFNLVIQQDKNMDKRRYNSPSADEIACLIVGNESNNCNYNRKICIYKNAPKGQYDLQIISDTHPGYDSLHYVLMFPNGKVKTARAIQQPSPQLTLPFHYVKGRFGKNKDGSNYDEFSPNQDINFKG